MVVPRLESLVADRDLGEMKGFPAQNPTKQVPPEKALEQFGAFRARSTSQPKLATRPSNPSRGGLRSSQQANNRRGSTASPTEGVFPAMVSYNTLMEGLILVPF